MTNPLYDNTETPFKDWPVEVQNEFFQAIFVRECPYELWNELDNEWICTVDFTPTSIYRLVPPEPVPDSVDWSVFNDDVICHARNENERAFAYTARPRKMMGNRWLTAGFEGAGATYINNLASYKRGNLPWDQSLVWKPGCEPEGEG